MAEKLLEHLKFDHRVSNRGFVSRLVFPLTLHLPAPLPRSFSFRLTFTAAASAAEAVCCYESERREGLALRVSQVHATQLGILY